MHEGCCKGLCCASCCEDDDSCVQTMSLRSRGFMGFVYSENVDVADDDIMAEDDYAQHTYDGA